MKLFIPIILLALSACATVTTQPRAPAAVNASPANTGTTTITGDELKSTGRPELGDALRASSPIFH
ncbi:MAG TPA: hypothetical protein VN692_19935 [Steroidobacteraceae bacterium]|nr:hypothetical protein [Steroidobacteraceae bacterium]